MRTLNKVWVYGSKLKVEPIEGETEYQDYKVTFPDGNWANVRNRDLGHIVPSVCVETHFRKNEGPARDAVHIFEACHKAANGFSCDGTFQVVDGTEHGKTVWWRFTEQGTMAVFWGGDDIIGWISLDGRRWQVAEKIREVAPEHGVHEKLKTFLETMCNIMNKLEKRW